MLRKQIVGVTDKKQSRQASAQTLEKKNKKFFKKCLTIVLYNVNIDLSERDETLEELERRIPI